MNKISGELSSSAVDVNGIPIEQYANDVARLSRRQRHLDSGWAWIVLAASFMIHIVLFGLMSAVPIFYSEFLADFKQGPVATSWLISTNCALSLISGPIGSILANKFGYRLVVIAGSLLMSLGYFISYFVHNFFILFWSYGILIGFGWGITYSPTFGILALFFDKRKDFATSFCTLAIGIGMFIIPPLLGLSNGYLTWRGSSLILTGISLNMIPCAMLFVTGHVEPKPIPQTFLQSADISLFKKTSFYITSLHFFLFGVFSVFNIIGLHFAVAHKNVPVEDAPLLVSVQGAAGTIGRLSAVVIGMTNWAGSPAAKFGIIHLSTTVLAIFIMVYTVTPNFFGLLFVTGIVGYSQGLRSARIPALMIDIFSPRRFSTSWSYVLCAHGIGGLLFPPFCEWIAVVSDWPDAPFYICGGVILISCSLTLILQFCFPNGNRTKSQNQSREVSISRKS